MERDKLNKPISKKPSGVFYIDGSKAYYFEQSLAGPINLNLPSEIISDFEIINKKKLVNFIQNFIKINKLVPKNIVFLLSVQVTFDKEFPRGSIEMQKNIQEFLELVPYEELLEKRILSSGKTRIVATNKEIVDSLKVIFKNAGFLVSGVYPLSLCMETIPSLKSNLDLSLFVNKISDLKGYNLQPIVEATYNKTPTPEIEKPDRTRLFVLGGVFIILMLILLYVVYSSIIKPRDEDVKIIPKPTLAPVAPIQVNEKVQIESTDIDATSSAIDESTSSATTGL